MRATATATALDQVERRYALRLVKQRLQQPSFRDSILADYDHRCAIGNLPDDYLLDAAHIMADADAAAATPKISANLFGCAAARNNGAAVCKNLKNVRRDRLEGTVLDALRDNLMDPELFREFCAEYLREINRVRGDENARRDRLRSELNQIERRLRRIVGATADGVPARALKDELLALEARQEQLEAELAAAPEAQRPLLYANLAQIYRPKVAALAEALADEAMRDEAFELIRSLLDKIVLVPEGEELRIEIRGELAGILEP